MTLTGETISDESLDALERAATVNPGQSPELQQFAAACMARGQVQRAERVLREMLSRQPSHPMILAHYAQALGDIGRFDEAIDHFEKALKLRPEHAEIRVAYGMELLRKGELARGWDFYDRRQQLQFDPGAEANIPPYTGGNLHGRTIMLLGEQGIGDTIMFARYAPWLAKRGANVVLVAHAAAASLLRTLPGNPQIYSSGAAMPPVHCHAKLMSLPRIFGTTLLNIPADIPYLRASPMELSAESTIRVGLVFAGNPTHSRDALRSMDLSDFSPLAEIPNVTFYSLQRGQRQEQAAEPPNGMRLIDLASRITGMTELAGAIAAMDLIISVDTAPAHLAGALGKKVWTLLPYSPDWRWLRAGESSPWYPTMRLFRQPALNDWPGAMMNVKAALREWVQRKS
jgi:hypothetical protein